MRAIRPWLPSLCVPGLVLLLSTCAPGAAPGGAGLVPPPPEAVLPCPAAVEESEEESIGNGGGRVRAGRGRLEVAPGAVPAQVRFRLTQRVASYVVVHAVPDGQRFGGAGATLTLSYEGCPGTLPPADRLRVLRWNPPSRTWDALPTDPGPGNREVSARLEHLSVYTIGTPN